MVMVSGLRSWFKVIVRIIKLRLVLGELDLGLRIEFRLKFMVRVRFRIRVCSWSLEC